MEVDGVYFTTLSCGWLEVTLVYYSVTIWIVGYRVCEWWTAVVDIASDGLWLVDIDGLWWVRVEHVDQWPVVVYLDANR